MSRNCVLSVDRSSGVPILRFGSSELLSSGLYLIDGAVAGSGHTFPWDAVSTVRRPFFLAGGLDSANVGEAVARLRPFAVDVSSSVESGGVKDFSKMAEFIAAVRNAGERWVLGTASDEIIACSHSRLMENVLVFKCTINDTRSLFACLK
jgi:hypothetical protein